ncbi:hypothetical protein JX265_000360 [Neoarthrinium moseri]|uniref:Rhodopsin domain-containing protein n=1 Tax=Neoarthrinium moseri TaxID=1658444 RepID=A0A9P9WYL6_9PEZI|nr:uncharacterized protein JN550_000610 [Neoarthrinium moseri]KAI1878428.1 hypothetical protein JN550_000610 [Neoarthrinium moseri]KAI1881534.1 hypothetical protein JX265_000360 [Neoarthrinium moseri]
MAIFTDDAPHVAGTVITVTLLAFLTLGLRFYTRITRASWGKEDTLMAVAAVPFAVLSIACLVSSFNGVGIHEWRLQLPENIHYHESGLFWFFLFEVFYCVTIIPVKLSISFMLIRIAENRSWFIYAQYIIMAMFTLMNLIAAFYIIFQCNPVSAAWDSVLQAEGTHCRPAVILADIYYATTAVNIFTDWATALMPIPLLWNVKMNINQKISVATILGLGIFASLSACIRLKYTVLLTSTDEYLFGLANIVIWGYAENGLGMFVGNLSTLRPLFRTFLGLGSSGGDTVPTGLTPNGLPSKSAHPYRSFDAGYEMGTVHSTKDRKGDIATSTQILGGLDKTSRGSLSSDGESQKNIVEKPSRGPGSHGFGPGGIVVSRQIDVHHN